MVLLVGALGWTTMAGAARPDAYVLPGEDVFPEGVAFDRSSGYFYVSSTTNGAIFRGHVNNPLTEVFLPGNQDGRTTATGLEVDHQGRLFVSGGGSPMVFVYEAGSGTLLAALGVEGAGFINDVAVTPNGDAFFTDSLVPVIYRVSQDASGAYVVEDWLDLTGTAIEYVQGFNVNGIVVSQDGRYLIVVQSNTGELFRIEIATREVVQIDLGGAVVTAGDGLVLRGRRLFVVRNALGQIDIVRLALERARGKVAGSITDDSFAFPTTADFARGRLLVVNSQFNQRGGEPVLPFTVSAVQPAGGGN
jgi:Cu-Zn family superoxide dismutase